MLECHYRKNTAITTCRVKENNTMDTEYGYIDNVSEDELELGELVVTDYGIELEVVGLNPVRFEPAPEESEDWGE